MKNTYLFSILLFLVSCGGGGGSKSETQTKDESRSPVTEQLPTEIACLENKFRWIEAPPRNAIEVFDKISDTEFEKCGSLVSIDDYMERVKAAHPNMTF